jgi:hypothetical protein
MEKEALLYALYPIFPVIWIASEVHHSKNDNSVLFEAVKNRIGESIHETPSHVSVKQGPRFWKLQNPTDRRLDLEIEVMSEAMLARLVVLYRFAEILVGLGMEGMSHLANNSRALA